MNKFILVSFAVLALVFYEASGGSDFNPEETRKAAVDTRVARAEARSESRPSDSSAAAPRAAVETTAAVPTQAPSAPTRSTEQTSQAEPINLNLAAYEDVADTRRQRNLRSSEQTPSAVQPAPTQLPPPLPQTTSTQFSLADIATASEQRGGIAFSGQTISSAPRQTEPQSDFRTVKGTLVNMRSGPGTEYDVVDQLVQNTEVEILSDTGNGWAEVRALETGSRGWIAEFLLNNG